VAGDSNGLYNLWYQTNLSDETTTYSDSFAASKDEVNPANPGQEMRFHNKGWKLWLEDADPNLRQRLKVDDLGLEEDEYITLLKLEFGRVEKGFTSSNKGAWTVSKDAPFYNDKLADIEGLAPLSYLVYCPKPLERIDVFTGEETVIRNSASSHITRNINLCDDDEDAVETRLVDSFTLEGTEELQEEESSSDRVNDLSKEPARTDDSEPNESTRGVDSGPTDNSGNARVLQPHSPKTGDSLQEGIWLALAAAAACTMLALIGALVSQKRTEQEIRGN